MTGGGAQSNNEPARQLSHRNVERTRRGMTRKLTRLQDDVLFVVQQNGPVTVRDTLTVERERETERGNGRVAHWSADGKYGLCGAKLLGIPAANLDICDVCARLREELYEARRAKQ